MSAWVQARIHIEVGLIRVYVDIHMHIHIHEYVCMDVWSTVAKLSGKAIVLILVI